MKKLLVLTAVVVLAIGSTGCQTCDWLWRGSRVQAPPAFAAPMCYDPCETGVPACGPCGATGVVPGYAAPAPN